MMSRIALAAVLSGLMFIPLAGAQDLDTHGVARLSAQGSIDEASDRLRSGLEKRDMQLMAVVDHRANAESVGLALPPTRTFIFGKPQIGTLLMQCQGSVALDLPQKMVLSEQGDELIIEWNDPHYLAERHDLSGCDLPLEAMAEALSELAEDAIGSQE